MEVGETGMKEIVCDICGNAEVFILRVEYWEQHCSPEKHGQRWMCDSCLAKAIGHEAMKLIVNQVLKVRGA